MAASRTLVIADGDLAGLLACAAAAARVPDAEHLVWIPEIAGPAVHLRAQAAQRQAELYGLTPVRPAGPGLQLGPDTPDDESATRLLVEAAFLARRHGAADVVWPIAAGGPDDEPDLDIIAGAVDRALLVSRLASLAEPPVRVSAPYADLSDHQIADLVVDMDLPVWTAWWWEPASAGGPGTAADQTIRRLARDEQRRWFPALRAAGWLAPTTRPAGASRSATPEPG